MTTSETPDPDHNITAFFDSREAAEQAIDHLVEAGLPRDKILLRIGAARKAAGPADDKSLMQEVKDLVLPAETSDAVCEAMRQEGFLLTLRPDHERHDALFDLLRRDGGRGIESREDIWPAWKSEPGDPDRIHSWPRRRTCAAEALSRTRDNHPTSNPLKTCPTRGATPSEAPPRTEPAREAEGPA